MRGETSGSVMARLPLKPNFSSEIWEWQGVEYCLPRHSQNEFSHLFWDEVSQNEDHLFCNLNEHTPIKKCSNLGHQITDVRDATTKGLEECREPLQLKRRRTLQFTSDSTEVMECSMVEDGVSKSLECSTLGFSDDGSAFNCGGLDQSSDEWLADCLNDGEIQCSLMKCLSRLFYHFISHHVFYFHMCLYAIMWLPAGRILWSFN
nr:PREDICTED: protein XRI1-like isoform X1 [Musa acuminata subsp. malaccensis]XP_018676051.1 PREDICTED: protein XRI1-like isoform X1 [Musa acuminata subsp. malaccensis]